MNNEQDSIGPQLFATSTLRGCLATLPLLSIAEVGIWEHLAPAFVFGFIHGIVNFALDNDSVEQAGKVIFDLAAVAGFALMTTEGLDPSIPSLIKYTPHLVTLIGTLGLASSLFELGNANLHRA